MMCLLYHILMINIHTQETWNQSLHPYKAYLKTLMKYKDYTAPDATSQGFVRQLDSVDLDYEDAADRNDLAESNAVEFFGETVFFFLLECNTTDVV